MGGDMISQSVRDLLDRIHTDETQWTDLEIAIALRVFKKHANCKRQRVKLPAQVFQADVEGNKTINSDLAILDANGWVYLVRRETKDENPNELWPGMLHLPGHTHDLEWLQEATEHLLHTEVAAFGLKYADLRRVAVVEFEEPLLGIAQSNLFVVRVSKIPSGIKGQFYRYAEIPWDEVVIAHKSVSLPWLHRNEFLL